MDIRFAERSSSHASDLPATMDRTVRDRAVELAGQVHVIDVLPGAIRHAEILFAVPAAEAGRAPWH